MSQEPLEAVTLVAAQHVAHAATGAELGRSVKHKERDMKQVPLTLQNLKQLDLGKIEVCFNHELEQAVRDCLDRPELKKVRQVAVIFSLAPVTEGGQCERVDVACDIKAKTPPRRTRVYTMAPRGSGLVFHPDAAEDPDANLLFDREEIDPTTGEVKKKR